MVVLGGRLLLLSEVPLHIFRAKEARFQIQVKIWTWDPSPCLQEPPFVPVVLPTLRPVHDFVCMCSFVVRDLMHRL